MADLIDAHDQDELPGYFLGIDFRNVIPETWFSCRLLVHEFEDIFSSELSATPADIPPFDFNVNDDQWRVLKNRQSPWSKSTVDQADILSQCTKLEKHNINEKSNAAYYSQVLLVPKSDGTKRWESSWSRGW